MRKIWILGVTLALGLALAGPAFAQGPIVHTVQPGENLFRIALRYGLTADALAAANGLGNASLIYVGQRLTIPSSSSTTSPAAPAGGTGVGSRHVVQAGENLFRIALRYGMTAQALAAANGIVNADRVYVGQQLVIPGQTNASPPPAAPAPSGQTYVVQTGDMLSAIALRYGVSTWALAQVNNIRNPSMIYVGQVLRIPSGGSPAAPPAPSSPLAAPPAAPSAPTGGRWIDVNLSAQQVTAYEGSTPVRSTLASTGLPYTPTPTGQYQIYSKYFSGDMAGPGYYLTGVPYIMNFYRGYSLHGTYWHSNFGQPMSHGCINLPTSEAQWLFNWAAVGTPVNIHY